MKIVGLAGELRCGYQVAARLGRWEAAPKIVGGPDVMLFHASVEAVDEYWITQEPLQLSLRVGRTTWVWPNVVPVRDGQTIHVDLKGKPEITPV